MWKNIKLDAITSKTSFNGTRPHFKGCYISLNTTVLCNTQWVISYMYFTQLVIKLLFANLKHHNYTTFK